MFPPPPPTLSLLQCMPSAEGRVAAGNSYKFNLSLYTVVLFFSAVCKSKMLALPLIKYASFVVVFLFATEVWSSCIVLASHLGWSFEWQWQSGACISQVQRKRANLMILLVEATQCCTQKTMCSVRMKWMFGLFASLKHNFLYPYFPQK